MIILILACEISTVRTLTLSNTQLFLESIYVFIYSLVPHLHEAKLPRL